MAYSFSRSPFVCSSEPISVDGQPWPEPCFDTGLVDNDIPGLEAWMANFDDGQTEEAAESPDLTPEDPLEPMPARLQAAWPRATSRASVIKGKATPSDHARRQHGAKRPREGSNGEGSAQDQGESEVGVGVDELVSKTAAPKKTAAAAPKPAPKKQKLLGSDDPKQKKLADFFKKN